MYKLVRVLVSGKLVAFFNKPSVIGTVLYVHEHGCDVSFLLPKSGTVTLYVTNKEIHAI